MGWRVIIAMMGLILLGGCGVRRTEVRERVKIADRSMEKITTVEQGEKWVIRDTVVMVRAPVEESRNVGMDSSRVETSLAWSEAVWKNGGLEHVIGNFPDIPSSVRTVYQERWWVRGDTLILRDTLREVATEYRWMEKKVPWWSKVWGTLGKMMVVIIAGYFAWNKLRSK